MRVRETIPVFEYKRIGLLSVRVLSSLSPTPTFPLVFYTDLNNIHWFRSTNVDLDRCHGGRERTGHYHRIDERSTKEVWKYIVGSTKKIKRKKSEKLKKII